MAHPLARFHFGNTKRVRRYAIKIRFGREKTCGLSKLCKLRILDHSPQSRISQAHAAIQKVVFQLAQNAVSLGVAIKVFKVSNLSFTQVAKRCGITVLAEPFANGRFAGVTKRRISDIVREAGGLHNRSEMIFVDVLGQILFNQVVHRNREAAAHARHFDAVSQATVHMVIHRERVHLGFTAKAPERCRKNNTVVIAVKVRTVRVQIGGVPVARRRKQSIPLKHT